MDAALEDWVALYLDIALPRTQLAAVVYRSWGGANDDQLILCIRLNLHDR